MASGSAPPEALLRVCFSESRLLDFIPMNQQFYLFVDNNNYYLVINITGIRGY